MIHMTSTTYPNIPTRYFIFWATPWSNRGAAAKHDRMHNLGESEAEALAAVAMYEVREMGRLFGPFLPR
jgi:hypothetical protein